MPLALWGEILEIIMKKILVFLIMLLGCAFVYGVTVESHIVSGPNSTTESTAYAHPDIIQRGAKRAMLVTENRFRRIRVVFDNNAPYVDMTSATEDTNAVYGYLERIFVDCNETLADEDIDLCIMDDTGSILWSVVDINSGLLPYNEALTIAAQDPCFLRFDIPVAGVLTIGVNDVNQRAEVTTLSLDANATAGYWSLTYNGVTTPSVDEVQTITGVGDPCAGLFQLTWGGADVCDVNWNSTAAHIDAKLEGLASIAAGDVTCTGGPLPNAVTITFSGNLQDQNVAAIVYTDVNLAGNADVNYVIATVTQGEGLAWDHTAAEIKTIISALSSMAETNDVNVVGSMASDVDEMVLTWDVEVGNVNNVSVDVSNLIGGPNTPTITETIEGGNVLSALEFIIFMKETWP